MRRMLGTAACAAVLGGGLLWATPSQAATLAIAVDDAEVDARGYYATVSATVTDASTGTPVAGVPLVFQKYRDGQARAEICRASTGADGVATCTDDPYPVGYGARIIEVDPTVADQHTLVYVQGDFTSYGLGDARLRLEPHCQPGC